MKKKILIYGLLFTTCILKNTQNVFAAEKVINIPVEKNYSSSTFTITAEERGNYTGSITAPDGTSYECSVIDDTTLSCKIEAMKEGEWKLTIKDETKDELPKFKVSFAAAKGNETNVVDNSISVGKDINGLSIYFKNDNLITEWSDESCGNVNVQVVNLDTSETISNEVVKNQYFECPIPQDVQNINVCIVPSTSSNIEGASINYSYKVDNNPNATVIFPDYEYTNLSSIPVTIELYDQYGIYVENNGIEVLSKDTMDKGTHTVDIPISYEKNNIDFYIVDSLGNMRSTSASYIYDSIAPELSLNEEYDGVDTYESTYSISGKILNYDNFTINGEPVSVATDGVFDFLCTLHPGINTIELLAADLAGNETYYSISLNMLEAEDKSMPPLIYILAAVLIIIFIYSFINKQKKQQTKNSIKKKTVTDDSNIEFKSEEIIINKKNDSIPYERNLLGLIKYILNDSLFSSLLIGMTSILILITFIIQINVISSSSMEPTLMTNDFAVFNRLAYVSREPKRGDIVNISINGISYGKRIIGVAGDHIEFIDGYVYINGEYYDETEYLDEDVETNCVQTFDVPDNCIFVLGDNREDSLDSRFWDNPYISISDITSKLLFEIPISQL